MLRVVFLIMIAFAYLACGEDGVDTEVVPAEMPVVEYPCPNFDRGDWILLVELPRKNLSPDEFRMADEWIDPITSAYVAGKDFLFVVYKPSRDGSALGVDRTGGNIYQARYYLDTPGLLYENTTLQVFHFVDPAARWFQHWDRAGRDRTKSGFTVTFDSTPMFEPSVPGVKKEREYLYSPQIGTSLDGLDVGGPGAPEIKADWVLNIYVR